MFLGMAKVTVRIVFTQSIKLSEHLYFVFTIYPKLFYCSDHQYKGALQLLIIIQTIGQIHVLMKQNMYNG